MRASHEFDRFLTPRWLRVVALGALALFLTVYAWWPMFAAYPKTPFPGAEISRMGLSMREDSIVLPLHHYLVLRRYLCAEPRSPDPFSHAL